ncbi:hypothetical protein BDW75DRAFT_222181 [Aspergillus navahoensis]
MSSPCSCQRKSHRSALQYQYTMSFMIYCMMLLTARRTLKTLIKTLQVLLGRVSRST